MKLTGIIKKTPKQSGSSILHVVSQSKELITQIYQIPEQYMINNDYQNNWSNKNRNNLQQIFNILIQQNHIQHLKSKGSSLNNDNRQLAENISTLLQHSIPSRIYGLYHNLADLYKTLKYIPDTDKLDGSIRKQSAGSRSYGIIYNKIVEFFCKEYILQQLHLHNPDYDFQLYQSSLIEDAFGGYDYTLFITNKDNYTTSLLIDLKTRKEAFTIPIKNHTVKHYNNERIQKYKPQRSTNKIKNIIIESALLHTIKNYYLELLLKPINYDQWIKHGDQIFTQGNIKNTTTQNDLNWQQFDITTWGINFDNL